MAVRAVDPVTGLPVGAAGTTGSGKQSGIRVQDNRINVPALGPGGFAQTIEAPPTVMPSLQEVPVQLSQPFGTTNEAARSIFDTTASGSVVDPVTGQVVPAAPAGFEGEGDLEAMFGVTGQPAAGDETAADAVTDATSGGTDATDPLAENEIVVDQQRDSNAALRKLGQIGSSLSREAWQTIQALLTTFQADDFSIDEDGTLHYSLGGVEVGSIPNARDTGRQQSFENEYEIKRFELSQRDLELSEAFRRDEMATNKKLEETNQAIARERITADKYIADGNWTNALAIQDSIDAREAAANQLQRDLANLDAQFKQQQLDLQREGFQLEKAQFMTELSTSPTGTVDLFNLSRGLPTVGMGGPIPGGLSRFGGDNPFLSALFSPNGPGIAPQVGDEPNASGGSGATAAAAGGNTGSGDANQEFSQGGQDVFALPPAIAAAFTGLQPNEFFGAAQQAEGGAPLLSQQQLSQMTPTERNFYDALVQMTGQDMDDFNALLAEVAPSQRVASSRVA